MSDKTHLLVCKNPKALEYLIDESIIIGRTSKRGAPMIQGDALFGRDLLEEQGFEFGKDFYIQRVD